MAKSKIITPFTAAPPAPSKTGNPGVYDRNPCPYFDKPHSMGPDTIPTRFTEKVMGSPGALDTPFDSALKNPKMNRK